MAGDFSPVAMLIEGCEIWKRIFEFFLSMKFIFIQQFAIQ